MFRLSFFFLLILTSNATTASNIDAFDKKCLSKKYDSYIDASVDWHHDLVGKTVQDDPALENVGNWFLKGRGDHFKLNQAVFKNQLKNAPHKLNFDGHVESWLKLTQEDVKILSHSQSELAAPAKKVFDFRQAQPPKDNYKLREAFAKLLKDPEKMNVSLLKYNKTMEKLINTHCKKEIQK